MREARSRLDEEAVRPGMTGEVNSDDEWEDLDGRESGSLRAARC